MDVQTYLFFDGSCEEALSFYTQTLQAEVLFRLRYKDGPPELIPPGGEEKIFHATMRIGDTVFNLADDMKKVPGRFEGFILLLHADSDSHAEQIFGGLADGGQIKLPIQKTFWASRYGIVTDRFGVSWKVQAGGGEDGTAAKH